MIGRLKGGLAAIALAGAAVAFAQSPPGPIPGLAVEPLAIPRAAGGRNPFGPLRYRGGVTIRSTADPTVFHGYSGLWVSPDGRTLAAVEGGKWITVDLRYDRRGNLAGFAPRDGGPLRDAKGRPFTDADDMMSEALDFDGRDFLVGFGGNARVLAYPDLKGAARPVALPDTALEGLGRGGSLSSVVALKGGGMLILPEYSHEDPRKREITATTRPRGWLRTGSGAEGPIWLRAAFPWMPSSVAELPDGDLLVLELHLVPDVGVDRARIGRVARREVTIGATMAVRPLAEFGPPMPAWRIEGTAVRRGPKGETLLYMMTSTAPARLYMFEVRGARR